MSISKLTYTNLTELKNNIFKDFIASPSIKDSLFTILITIQTHHPKLKLKDIAFTSDNNKEINFFYVNITYKNRIIKKVISKSDLKNIYSIILESLK
jgi:hypothetical protein